MNCEYGMPLWAAEFIVYLKPLNNITLSVVVPFEEQAVRWTEEYRNRYFRVHEKADNVTLASTQYHPSCYREAEQMMIDESDLLIIWGKPNSLPDKYRYAESQGVEAFYYPIE